MLFLCLNVVYKRFQKASKLALQDVLPPCIIAPQSHASPKTRERAPTCDTMRGGAGGGLNATLSDYLTSHSPVRKYYNTKRIILQ